MTTDSSQNKEQLINQEIDYIKIVKILWSRWYWVASSLIICLVFAYLYLWYTPPTYSTTATLKLDNNNNQASALLKASNSPLGTGGKSIETESFVLRSNPILLQAIGQLNYRVSYFIKGRFRTKDLYPFRPFRVEIITEDSLNRYQGIIDFNKISTQKFNYSYFNGEQRIDKSGRFGDIIQIPGYQLIIRDSIGMDHADYGFYLHQKEDYLSRVSKGLSIKELTKGSNILSLSQVDENPVFARDVINAIMEAYIEYDSQSQKQSATQTIDFIDQQLRNMSSDLSQAQNQLKQFKENNRIVDMTNYANDKAKQYSTLQNQLLDNKLQSINLDLLEEQVKQNKNKIYLNFNIEGDISTLLKSLIDKLNTLIIDRSSKIITYKEDALPIQEIDRQIADIRGAIIRNIQSLREKQNREIALIKSEMADADQNIAAIPEQQLSFMNLQRNYDLNDKIYSLFTEKKLDAEITRSAITPSVSVVNKASLSRKVLAPQAARIYTSAILVGLIISLLVIVLVRIVNPYIYDKETVESYTDLPIIGVVKKFPTKLDKSNKQVLSLEKPKSVFAESIRSVRTNLSFLAAQKKSKVICITSEIAGEGKSFMTINLASTLALIDKKVVIVAADLRKSKMHKAFEVDNDKGLSTYLAHQHEIEDVLLETHVDNLAFVPSGPNPPNPSELIQSERMQTLIDYLSAHFDFVLIDTAPLGLVSDSVPLIRNSDINLFVIRSGVSRIGAATVPAKVSREYNLNNVVIVLNAFENDSLYARYYTTNYSNSYYNSYYYYADYSGYYGYGYYDDEKPSWWKLISRIKYQLKKRKESD